MRHHNTTRKFHRERGPRIAFMRSLVEALILKEKILTTEARAKALRPMLEKMITRGKTGTIATRRQLASALGGRPSVVKKIVDTLGPRFKDRNGGYTRITKVVTKSSDGRSNAVIEFV
jgi:large subunit ribosomal protein L17